MQFFVPPASRCWRDCVSKLTCVAAVDSRRGVKGNLNGLSEVLICEPERGM